MNLLQPLLNSDPARPRITVYDTQADTHLDFSAKLLENWTAKVANMLREELDLEAGDEICIDLPLGWQPIMIALGAVAAGVNVSFASQSDSAAALFCAPDTDAPDTNVDQFAGDVVVVTNDAFGRGVEELGGSLPAGMIDFGPVVRMYGDQFHEVTPTFAELKGHSDYPLTDYPVGTRLLSTGWQDWPGFCAAVLSPLAVDGSAVIVSGCTSKDRLDHISAVEKATVLLV